MANTNIYPFGQNATMPAGYPIADNLTTDSAYQSLSAKQGKKIGDDLYTLKILSLGNSFSRDSFAYAPVILKEKFGIKLEICLLVQANCSLSDHYTNRTSTSYYPYCYYFDHSTNKWVSKTNKGLPYALGTNNTDFDCNWDVVVLQQNSGNSMDYSTYQPHLNNLIDHIAGIKPNVVFAWNLTHAWATGYQYFPTGVTMDDMAAAVKANADRVLAETAVSLMLPYGEAIRFARANSTLAAIGQGNLSYDNVHLQEGIGRQVAAYANAMAIMRFLHSKKGIVGDTTTVDSTFLSSHGITTTDNMTNTSQNGTVTGSTAANRLIAQRCAVMANSEYNYGTDQAKKTE